ncbi:MAG: CBS domain-containing protein [Gammaproteobacteria bacterium]|nr:CBS domain-containing protein [Gammaproteobacteria bacterium]
MSAISELVIGDVMTLSPLSIAPKEKLMVAQQLMSDKNIRHLPVVDNELLISVITDRDINLAVAANKNLQAAEELLIEDVCALTLYQVDRAETLSNVVSYMAENSIGSVLITSKGQLEGIFTATDACKYLSLCLKGQCSDIASNKNLE